MLFKRYKLTSEIYKAISDTIGSVDPERGGIIGTSNGTTIDHYYYDSDALCSHGTYMPNIKVLNEVISTWREKGIEFLGFIHSHPLGFATPSEGDDNYVAKILTAMDMKKMLLMVVQNISTAEIYTYEYTRGSKTSKQIKVSIDKKAIKTITSASDTFARIRRLFPMDEMERKVVIVIGVGGAMSFVDNLARCGIRNFLLIDPDKVSETNIATQQAYLSDIGRYKVEVVKDRLMQINPNIKVFTSTKPLDDNMSDVDFLELVGPYLETNPLNVLICGCTDSFHAQARSAAIALKYKVPYIAAQLYAGGEGAEIYFYHPSKKHVCPRCVMESRYEAYENGYENSVTSDSAPIFATERVNSLKGQLALALMLYGAHNCSRYSTMLDEIGNRNFVQLNMSPYAARKLNISLFDNAANKVFSFFDDAFWIPQYKRVGCPLCDNSNLGTKDTREVYMNAKTSRL